MFIRELIELYIKISLLVTEPGSSDAIISCRVKLLLARLPFHQVCLLIGIQLQSFCCLTWRFEQIFTCWLTSVHVCPTSCQIWFLVEFQNRRQSNKCFSYTLLRKSKCGFPALKLKRQMFTFGTLVTIADMSNGKILQLK